MNKLILTAILFTVFACVKEKKEEKSIYYFLQKPTKELQESIAKEDQLENERLDSLKDIEDGEYINQYNLIFELYKSHQIIELRNVFDLYRTKSLEELRKIFPIDKDIILNMWNYRNLFQSKFSIINSRVSLGGGFDYLIIFKNEPDRIFQVWVYTGPKDVVRAFEELEFNKQERIEIIVDYKRLIEDTIHSI